MYSIAGKLYAAYLKEKEGEMFALKLLGEDVASRTLPILLALPLSEKENKGLSADDVVKREVGRIQSGLGDNVCLWDSRFLDLSDGSSPTGYDKLRHLLRNLVLFGAKVIPVVDIYDNYHKARALGDHAKEYDTGLALRIDTDSAQDYELIAAQLSSCGVDARDCILLLDISSSDVSQPEQFSRALAGWLLALRARHRWAKIIVAGSSYPAKTKYEANRQLTASRNEWLVWEHLLRAEPEFKDAVLFGDFGADTGEITFPKGGRARPHIRYLIDAQTWYIGYGTTVFSSIRDVSKRIISESYFAGRDYCAGDEFIADWASATITVGTPSKWRSANMNHHITLMVESLLGLYGSTVTLKKRETPRQLSIVS